MYSLKYLRSMTLGCTDIGNKKPEFVAKTQFLYKLVVNEIKKGIRRKHQPIKSKLPNYI